MQLQQQIYRPLSRTFLLIAILWNFSAQGQINSPYSRYGIGDLYVGRPVAAKAMGGVASAYSDPLNINFINPASYSRLQLSTFDVGMEIENRTLREPGTNLSYTSANLIFNSLAIGVPLMRDKKTGQSKWGLAFGLRPVSRINYKVEERSRIAGIDSALTLYEGSGGTFRAFAGTGYRIGGLSIGINGGFYFGQEDISTKRSLLNDSVFYFQANYLNKISFAKFAFDGGLQYEFKVAEGKYLTLGLNGQLGTTINANSDILRETFYLTNSGATDSIDVALRSEGNEGEINLPAGYTVGLAFEASEKLKVLAEYEATNWDEFSFFGNQGNVRSTSMIRLGGQYMPNYASRRFYERVSYRAGFYTGKDYVVDAGGTQLPVWGVSVGFGIPIRNYNAYIRQSSVIHTSFEFGSRGNDNNPIQERFFRINASFTLSDLWFIKRRFD